jgi:hypothetical protein
MNNDDEDFIKDIEELKKLIDKNIPDNEFDFEFELIFDDDEQDTDDKSEPENEDPVKAYERAMRGI